jgi:hypothetical protein
LSRAMLMHSLLTLVRHPMVTAEARQQIRTQFGVRSAEVSAKAVTCSVPPPRALATPRVPSEPYPQHHYLIGLVADAVNSCRRH